MAAKPTARSSVLASDASLKPTDAIKIAGALTRAMPSRAMPRSASIKSSRGGAAANSGGAGGSGNPGNSGKAGAAGEAGEGAGKDAGDDTAFCSTGRVGCYCGWFNRSTIRAEPVEGSDRTKLGVWAAEGVEAKSDPSEDSF